MESDSAHIPEQSVMDVLDRALQQAGSAERVVIVLMSPNDAGDDDIHQFSNARSSAELCGMYVLAQKITTNTLR